MSVLLACFLIAGYLAIAFEHVLRVNKAAIALVMGVGAWVLVASSPSLLPPVPEWFAQQGDEVATKHAYLVEHVLTTLTGETAGLLFFLMGAMTIVELVDANHGFELIAQRVRTSNLRRLLWLVTWLAFFMSSVLDNLTTTIVMVSVLRKVVEDAYWRKYLVGLVVVAANAGGVWTPIGDVTTTMMWMAHKYETFDLVARLAIPSAISLLVPVAVVAFLAPREVAVRTNGEAEHTRGPKPLIFLALGFLGLLGVPIFKSLTHLPPYLGMLASVSAIWLASEVLHRGESGLERKGMLAVLQRIDLPSVLFFLGILLAVGALGAAGLLEQLAATLDRQISSPLLVAFVIGLVSAVVDNVPLVAAGIEMYTLPAGHDFWLFLAYCAGTGGSCLVIGSAAGVTAMGLEGLDFVWYLKRIAPLALLGYLAGAAAFAFA